MRNESMSNFSDCHDCCILFHSCLLHQVQKNLRPLVSKMSGLELLHGQRNWLTRKWNFLSVMRGALGASRSAQLLSYLPKSFLLELGFLIPWKLESTITVEMLLNSCGIARLFSIAELAPWISTEVQPPYDEECFCSFSITSLAYACS